MQCLTPVTLVKAYREMGSRWQDACHLVPCGKCPVCLKKRQMDWCFRMETELNRSESGCFITLTYEQPPLSQNGLMTLDRSHLQKFIKRLRIENPNRTLKYYAVGEYGSKYQRPHYHLIVFNLRHYLIQRSDLVADIWMAGRWENASPGIIQIDACTSGSIGYVAGYCQSGTWVPDHCEDTGLLDDRVPHYSVMSKKLGLNYLTPAKYNYHVQTKNAFITRPGGTLQRLPRYFRDKIYTKSEKREIAELTKAWAEKDFNDLFRNPAHEIAYKKRQFEKHAYERIIERQAL